MSFSDDIRKFVDKTNLSMDTVVRKVTLDLAHSLIARSPVDKGRFKGNWFPGVGTVDTTTDMDIRDPDGSKSTERIDAVIGEAKAGGVLYITNSLPYAIPLEYGHSGQAPNGMVRLAVSEYASYIEKAVRDIQ